MKVEEEVFNGKECEKLYVLFLEYFDGDIIDVEVLDFKSFKNEFEVFKSEIEVVCLWISIEKCR